MQYNVLSCRFVCVCSICVLVFVLLIYFFFFKQKTAYEMRISDWSSDVCSSDLMGAMENKGLNIFNDKFILADAATATDADFQRIEGIVAHEYFHNWTGNRITCRDWFQLSLKEGLTVFRDQEFSADMHDRGVKRVADVRLLRTVQFHADSEIGRDACRERVCQFV